MPMRHLRSLALRAAALLAFGPILAACAGAGSLPGAGDDPDASPVPAEIDGFPSYMYKGDLEAPVTLVEWSDYQCPYCARHTAEVSPQIDQTYVDGGQVRVLFRDFPLGSIHPHAVKAAEAARCAGDAGGSAAYWAMHDRLFAEQAAWSEQEDPAAIFKGFAADQGLAAEVFAACLDGGTHADAVNASYAEAIAKGFTGTPTFELGGSTLEGALPFEDFKAALDVLVAGGALPTGTPLPPTPEMVEQDAPVFDIELGDAPAKGDPDAPVTLVEWSDFQCPFCAQFVNEGYRVLMDEFVATGRVRYVFKDMPLVSIHPEAQAASEAAHCARDQGGDEAFFAMHDALFAGQDRWSQNAEAVDVFGTLAEEGGLDKAALVACVEAGTHKARVEASTQEAMALGLTGTPSFAINGQLRAGVPPPDALRETLEMAERGEPLKVLMPKATETTGVAGAGLEEAGAEEAGGAADDAAAGGDGGDAAGTAAPTEGSASP